ncbi:MAG: WD40 repeat domain-containing protein, partial [Anaerolineae bacterium]|nr:WD40 repeat domain-containing protein [Anaerolineae bacterium]
MKNNPYVGPRPFERSDRHNFYGRTREARELLSLILAERAVLFYAPSGAGKTSLLNTMIIPALEEEGFHPLPVTRVGSPLPPGIDPAAVENIFVFSALMGLAGAGLPPAALLSQTLPSFLPRYCADRSDREGKPPLLILDQFEEIFTRHRERSQEIRGFFEQVAEALKEMPSLGVLFVMSEERLARIDPYAPLFPWRLRTRFRMERLDRDAALEAIKMPAQNAGCPFDEGVAERLVDNLRRIRVHPSGEAAARHEEEEVLGPFVEPVQLQVVCSQLWENLPDQEDHTIQWHEVEQFGDVDRALIAFYEKALARCVQETGVAERTLRQWFGEQLITPLRTRSLVWRGAHETAGLPNAAVDSLEAQLLIHAEMRGGVNWYEISHDRLIDPILRSNQEWELARQTPLRLAARRWKESGDSGILYRGHTLEEALDWARSHPTEVEPYEQEFLDAALQAERSRIRKRNLQIVAAITALVIIIVVSTLAGIAYRASRIARSREWASNSLRYRLINQEQSIIMAQKAVEEANIAQAQIALRQAVTDFYPARRLEGAEMDYAVGVAYSPDGSMIATSLADGRILLWDTMTLHPVQTITIPGRGENWIWGLAFSPDGRYLASGGNPPIRIWEVSSGREVARLEGHTGLVTALAFSPDGRYLASGSYDRSARIWKLATGTAVYTITAHPLAVRSVAFSPDGHLLATASWDRRARLWRFIPEDDGSVTVRSLFSLVGHTGGINSAVFSPDGMLLATASDDKLIRLWTVNTGEAALTLVGHTDQVMSLSFSADGRLLASASRDGTVRLWDVALRRSEAIAVLTGHTGPVNGVAFDPRGRFLASTSGDKTVRLWDTTPPAGARFTTLGGHRRTVTSLDYSPDGSFLASGSADGTVRVWSAHAGETVATLPIYSVVWDVTYSPDGRYLAVCSADGLVRLWDTTALSASPVMTLAGHTDEAEVAAFSPDGRYLATAADDGQAFLWDLSTGQAVFTMTGHTGAIYALAYSPDGSLIATGSTDEDVRLWDAHTGALLKILSGHTHDVFDLAFSPDGKYLASAAWDYTVRLWDMKTLTTAYVLEGHDGYVYSIAFSPDGGYLASAPWDRTPRLWDLSERPPGT